MATGDLQPSLAGQRPTTPWWRWVLAALGPAAFIAMISAVGPTEVARAFAGADAGLLVLAHLVALPSIAFRAERWRRIIGLGHELPSSDALSVYAYSVAIGTPTPGRLGEFVKVFHLVHRGVPMGHALATVVVDRLFDVVFLMAVGVLGAILIGAELPMTALAVGFGLFVTAILLTPLVLCRAGGHLRQMAAGGRSRILERTAHWADHLCSGLRTLRLSGFAMGAALTVGAWSINYFANYLLACALHLDLGFFDIAAVSAIGTLAALLPISVMGAGTRDLATVAVLAHYGISKSQSLALSMCFLTLVMFTGLVCALSLLHPGARAIGTRRS